MTVKQRTGRRRYIAVRISPAPPTKGDFLRALRNRMQHEAMETDSMRLLVISSDVAILACRHSDLRRSVALLNGSVGTYRSRTLLVSGTIRTLKERFSIH